MAGLRGVHEEGRGAGGGQRGGDLACHMAGFAQTRDDHAALGFPNEIDGGGEGRPERTGKGCGNRGDAAAPGIERAQRRRHGGVRVIGAG